MKNLLKINFAVILFATLSCNKAENTTLQNQKEVIFLSTQKFSDFNKIDRTFKIFKDSSYVFTEIVDEVNHKRNEIWEGNVKIKNDTLKFSPFELDYNNSETAVLKNGFIEFIDGEYLDKMKIEKTSLPIKNLIDFENFKDYALFTFYQKFNDLPSQKDFKNHDLTTKELMKIDTILKQEFSKNNKLKPFSEYLKQIESVQNKKGDNIIFIHCYCKIKHLEESFKYYQSSMMDGGKCNIFIQLNLTTGKIEVFNIAGMA